MEIQEQIQRIIIKRSERLPVIEEKLRILDEIQERVSMMESVRAQMIQSDGNLILNSRFAPMLQKNPDMVWGLQALDFTAVHDASAKARKALKAYKARCARQTVNISVVGKARNGKSELLKAISGLDDYVIPAFDSTDCTGAPSIIYNEPGSQLRAELHFKTSREMLEMARRYLNKLIPNPEEQPYLQRMEDISRLDMDQIREKVPMGSPEGVKIKYLAKMADHYNEWAPYADGDSIILRDKAQIITFVAQNNGVKVGQPGREEYYKYLAVSTCEITCSFPQAGVGSICLIDTIGLGDHTDGILDSMLQTVRDHSDAVIFNHMPKDGAGEGLPEDVYKIYKEIQAVCGSNNLDKWIFYSINHVTQPTEGLASNTQFCQSALKMLSESKWLGADNAKIIDLMDPSAVRTDFLMPLLTSLLENLDSIDETYRIPAESALKALQGEYTILCSRAQKVLCSDIRSNASLAPLINQLTERGLKTLRAELFHARRDWLEKRDQPCAALYGNAEDIFRRMTQENIKDAYLPKQTEILKELNSGVVPSTLYTTYANAIRTCISRDFLEVDVELNAAISEMKNGMAYILYENCNMKQLCSIPEGERPAYRWFLDFAENVLGSDYPNIRSAVEALAHFEFSVKGFLTYEIRRCLDELDMSIANVPPLINTQDGNLNRTAMSIYSNLHRALCHIASTLKDVMKDLCIKPNRAMFAEVADFCDRIYYSEHSEMEWRNFFANQSSLLWAEELKQQQTIGVLFHDWLDLVEGVQQYNKKSVFEL